MTSVIFGASRLSQLHDNLASLEITLTPEQLSTLNAASVPAGAFFSPDLRRAVSGGADGRNWDEQGKE